MREKEKFPNQQLCLAFNPIIIMWKLFAWSRRIFSFSSLSIFPFYLHINAFWGPRKTETKTFLFSLLFKLKSRWISFRMQKIICTREKRTESKIQSRYIRRRGKSVLRKCFFITHSMLLLLDKHVSFRSIYMGKLLKLSENFLLADIDTTELETIFKWMRYFSMGFHRNYVFFLLLLALVVCVHAVPIFDITQFPSFASFPFAIQFSFDRKIWQKWQFSSSKNIYLSHSNIVTPLTYQFLLLDLRKHSPSNVILMFCCLLWINFGLPLRHC